MYSVIVANGYFVRNEVLLSQYRLKKVQHLIFPACADWRSSCILPHFTFETLR